MYHSLVSALTLHLNIKMYIMFAHIINKAPFFRAVRASFLFAGLLPPSPVANKILSNDVTDTFQICEKFLPLSAERVDATDGKLLGLPLAPHDE